MMKKLYFVSTNGYDMIVSIDSENNCRYLTETEEFPYIVEDDPEDRERKALEFLNSVEDDTSWEDDLSFEAFNEILEDAQNEVLAKIEKEL